MNLSGANIQSFVLKHLLRQFQIPTGHAFTVRSASHFRKPKRFDGRGGRDRRQVVGNLSLRDSFSINLSTLPFCCLGALRNHTFTAGFHTTSGKFHGEYEWQDPKSEEEIVKVQVIDKEGKVNDVRGKIGDNLLYLSKRFDVGMEGACEASLACTTCHVYVDHDFLDLLPESTETEEDLLDQAPFLKENSRLGCQIILNKQLDGIKLTLPSATKNFYVDGHKPTPH